MNNQVFGCLAALASLPVLAFAQNASPAQPAPADDPLQTEIALVTQAHATALVANDLTVVARFEAVQTSTVSQARALMFGPGFPRKEIDAREAGIVLAKSVLDFCG